MEFELKNLTKEFAGVKAVDSVSETLVPGVYGLLGVNGAGKTTLMRMLTTLLTPSSGTALWDGEDIFAMEGRFRNILGYLPQDFGFYPNFTVEDYLLYISSIKGLRPAAAKLRVRELLHQVGLSKAAKKKMKNLSGGMKRRAGIAQAMLNDPKLLILDEPTAGLDPNERIRFRNLISELSEERIVLFRRGIHRRQGASDEGRTHPRFRHRPGADFLHEGEGMELPGAQGKNRRLSEGLKGLQHKNHSRGCGAARCLQGAAHGGFPSADTHLGGCVPQLFRPERGRRE